MKQYRRMENIGRIRLEKPIEYTVEYNDDDKTWSVGSEELDIWGFGKTEEKAYHEFVCELRKKIDELKQWLDERIEESDKNCCYWLMRKIMFGEVRRKLDEV